MDEQPGGLDLLFRDGDSLGRRGVPLSALVSENQYDSHSQDQQGEDDRSGDFHWASLLC